MREAALTSAIVGLMSLPSAPVLRRHGNSIDRLAPIVATDTPNLNLCGVVVTLCKW